MENLGNEDGRGKTFLHLLIPNAQHLLEKSLFQTKDSTTQAFLNHSRHIETIGGDYFKD